jgi:hypothetical protein
MAAESAEPRIADDLDRLLDGMAAEIHDYIAEREAAIVAKLDAEFVKRIAALEERYASIERRQSRQGEHLNRFEDRWQKLERER